jgi:hypothetical protein
VKLVISRLRANALRKKCRTAVIIGHCRLVNKTVVNVGEFERSLIRVLANNNIMYQKARFLSEHSKHRRFLRTSYEELMGDKRNIDKVLQWAGANPETMSWLPEASTGRCKGGCFKNTPDDLREILANYDEVESWIQTNYPCLLHQLHETGRDVVQKRVVDSCGNIFKDRILNLMKLRNEKERIFFNSLE